MNQELKISYETVGGSSYLAITLPPEAKLVNYQLGMMMDNEIKGFLPAFKRVMNGETVIYYNITSKIPLGQLLEKRKLKRTEFTYLIEGMLTAVREASEYRLPESGLLLDPEYIYMNPSTCEPGIIFLPLSEQRGRTLRQLVQELVIHGRIELSNDNFIQVLLNVLNEEPFSVKRMEECLQQFTSAVQFSEKQQGNQQNVQGFEAQSGSWQRPQGSGMQQESWQRAQGQGVQQENWQRPQGSGVQQESWQRTQDQGVQQEGWQRAQGQGMQYETGQALQENLSANSASGEKEEAKQKKGFLKGKKNRPKPEKGKKEAGNKASEEAVEDGFDPEKAKKKFMLPQAVLMVALAAGISFGLFTDAAGGILVNHVLAAVIAVAVLEVVFYREAYVNSKGEKKTAEKGKKSKKEAENKKKAKKEKKTKPEAKMDSRKRPKLSGQQEPALEAAPKRELRRETEAQEAARRETARQDMERREAARREAERQEAAYREMAGQKAEWQGNAGQNTGWQGNSGSNMAWQEPVSSSSSWQGAGWQNSVQPGFGPQAGNFGKDAEDTQLAEETELWGEDSLQGQGAPAYLEFFENGSITRIPLGKPEGVIVGRLRSQADFVVTNARVGKVHAKFFGQNGQYFVVDINSKNGTFINGNGQRINSNVPYPLHDNDRITLADSEFTIRCPQR